MRRIFAVGAGLTAGLLVLIMVGCASTSSPSAVTAPAPPRAAKQPHVTTLHGEQRVDEYHWLREKTNAAMLAHLRAENAYTKAVLKPATALRKRLFAEMRSHLQETDTSVPYRKGDWLYYHRTEKGRQYAVHCRKRSLDAPENVILDLNRLARGEKFLALGEGEVSDDGHLLAYTLDRTGFREYALRVKDLRTGRLLADRAEGVSSVAWAADNRTLFYTTEDSAKRSHRLWRKPLGGTPVLVLEEPDERFELSVERTRSGEFLLLIADSHTQNEIRFLPAAHPEGEWRVIEPRAPELEYSVDHSGESFYLLVNDRGRNSRLVRAPVAIPGRAQWEELIAHRDDVLLTHLDCFATHYVVFELENALPHIRVAEIVGGRSQRISFAEPIYDVNPEANEVFAATNYRYAYESFVTPDSVYDYDFATGQSALLKREEVPGGYDATHYVAERIYAPAPDGRRVPISLVRRRDTPVNGSAPLLLGGYGAYGIWETASFNPARLSLLDRGAIIALAHIRGGADLGKGWHDEGRMRRKRNTFTDFIAAADQLVAAGYTRRDLLAIEGGSAGGLLIGASLNLRPDLCGAALLHVPFVDVINTMLDEELPLTVGEFEEWGNPKIREDYEYIRSYSPYDNLQAVRYPAIMVTTSLNDSQVMYWEPAKYVARLRTLKTDDQPLLLDINLAGGHGGSSGRYDRLRERARDYAFLLWCWERAGGMPGNRYP
jgi:oligopeptidase B